MCAIVRVRRHAWNERFEWARKKECEWVKASVMMCHHHLFWTNLYAIHQRASFCCWGCRRRGRRRRWRRERERVFAHLQWVKRCASVCFFIICHILRIVFGFCMLRHSRIASRSHTENHCWMSYFIRIQIWCPVVSWEIIAYACVPMNYQARVCDMVEIVILERKK